MQQSRLALATCYKHLLSGNRNVAIATACDYLASIGKDDSIGAVILMKEIADGNGTHGTVGTLRKISNVAVCATEYCKISDDARSFIIEAAALFCFANVKCRHVFFKFRRPEIVRLSGSVVWSSIAADRALLFDVAKFCGIAVPRLHKYHLRSLAAEVVYDIYCDYVVAFR